MGTLTLFKTVNDRVVKFMSLRFPLLAFPWIRLPTTPPTRFGVKQSLRSD